MEPYLEGPAQYEQAWQLRPDEQELRRRTDELLDRPLSMDAAVELGILNHPGLRADIRQIDVIEAELRQETTLQNPEVESDAYFSQFQRSPTRLDSGLHFEVTSILDRASRVAAADAAVEVARVDSARRVIDFIRQIRQAWIDYVAANERLGRVRDIAEASEALAESARIHHEAGNISDDELRRLQAHGAEAELAVYRVQRRLRESRNSLHDRLGISVDRQDWSVPESLPEVPEDIPDVTDYAQVIASRSIAVRYHRRQHDEFDARLSAERWQGWFPRLQLGAVADIGPDRQIEVGPSAQLVLPVFDRRQHLRNSIRAQKIEADLRIDQARRSTQLAIRDLQQRLESTHRQARHYQSELLPLRRQIVDDTLRQYNAMTVGVFEVLEVRREHLQAERDAVDTRREFWRSRIDFDHLLAGGELSTAPDASRPIFDTHR